VSVYIVGGKERGDKEAYTLRNAEEHKMIGVSEARRKSKESVSHLGPVLGE